jgi:hypothetical protein
MRRRVRASPAGARGECIAPIETVHWSRSTYSSQHRRQRPTAQQRERHCLAPLIRGVPQPATMVERHPHTVPLTNSPPSQPDNPLYASASRRGTHTAHTGPARSPGGTRTRRRPTKPSCPGRPAAHQPATVPAAQAIPDQARTHVETRPANDSPDTASARSTAGSRPLAVSRQQLEVGGGGRPPVVPCRISRTCRRCGR